MAAKHREKDQAMAAAMKAAGVKRESARCPICNAIVSLKQYQNHVGLHK